jgi:hypothetical protein
MRFLNETSYGLGRWEKGLHTFGKKSLLNEWHPKELIKETDTLPGVVVVVVVVVEVVVTAKYKYLYLEKLRWICSFDGSIQYLSRIKKIIFC